MCCMYAQDIAGDYRLNGTHVVYTSIFRGTAPQHVLIDALGGAAMGGVTLPALTFGPGDGMNLYRNGPFPKNALNALDDNI